jgi:hypothetical protein
MVSKQIHLFATRRDLEQGIRPFENESSLKYAFCGLFSSSDIHIYSSLFEIKTLGKTTAANQSCSGSAARNATQLEFEFVENETHYLYQQVGANGEHLKFGVTDDLVGRYSKAELNGGRLKVIAQGEKSEMLRLERDVHETLPIGPKEGQKFYIQKQVQKGLLPPSQYQFPP